MMQRWHVYSLGTILSETVTMFLFSAAPTAACCEPLVAFQDSRNDQRSQSHDIHLFPINNSSLDADWYSPLPPAPRWHVKQSPPPTELQIPATVTTLSAPSMATHIRHWSDISHITSQTMMGISRLGYSCWLLVAGYLYEVLRWWPEWVGVRYHARVRRMHVSNVHCSPAQTAFTAHRWTNNAHRR